MRKILFIFLLLGIISSLASQEWRALDEFNINNIKPDGWLENWLFIQKKGLTGNIDSAGYPFNTGMWKSEIKVKPENNPSWWPYEQTAYWIDGALRCGYLLNDEELIKKADEQITHVFDHPSDSGILGPKHFSDSKWPHAVLFRAVMAKFMVTKDTSLVEKMIDHFKATKDNYTSFFRNNLNIEIMCWLYDITGDEEMLDLAEQTFLKKEQKTGYVSAERMLSDTIPFGHGVSYHENLKIPVILYIYTGKQKYLDATRNAFRKLDKHHMLVDGVPSAVEGLAGKAPHMAHESCNIIDYAWSAGYMLMATGEAEWADKIERAFFNAGFGAIDKDFTSHQYYSSPNQAIADYKCSHWDCMNDWYNMDSKRLHAFRAAHTPECCAGNFNRMAPNYISRMWMDDNNNGITATLYGPGTLIAEAGTENEKVTVKQNTEYPFSGEIVFSLEMENKIKFPFTFRIPSWCKDGKIYYNDKEVNMELSPGSFATLEKKFSDGDKIKLVFPMKLQLKYHEYNGVSIERGPLVYSFPIEAERKKMDDDRVSSVLSSWEMKPKSHWQYALNLTEEDLDEKVEVIKSPIPENPWIRESTPIKLKVTAYELEEWDLFKEKLNPIMPSKLVIGEEKEITLVPLGATLLRLTIFPDVNKHYSCVQRNNNSD